MSTLQLQVIFIQTLTDRTCHVELCVGCRSEGSQQGLRKLGYPPSSRSLMISSALWRRLESSSLVRSFHCSDCVDKGKWAQSPRRDSSESFPCSLDVGGLSGSDGWYGGGGDVLTWEEARRDLAGGRGRGVIEPASIRMSEAVYVRKEDPCNRTVVRVAIRAYSPPNATTWQKGRKRTATRSRRVEWASD